MRIAETKDRTESIFYGFVKDSRSTDEVYE